MFEEQQQTQCGWWAVGEGRIIGEVRESGPGIIEACGPVIRTLGLVLRAKRRRWRVSVRELQSLSYSLDFSAYWWNRMEGRGLRWKKRVSQIRGGGQNGQMPGCVLKVGRPRFSDRMQL